MLDRPTLSVVHHRKVSIPASDRAKMETGALSIAGADVTHPINSPVGNPFLTDITSTPYDWI